MYVVGGGAGAELYDVGMGTHTAYSEKTHSAAMVRVTRSALELDAFRPDGSAISTPDNRSRFSKTK